MVWKGRADPSPNFWGSDASFLEVWASSAVRLKLCISPLGLAETSAVFIPYHCAIYGKNTAQLSVDLFNGENITCAKVRNPISPAF